MRVRACICACTCARACTLPCLWPVASDAHCLPASLRRRFQDVRVAMFKLVLLSAQKRPHEELLKAALPLRVRISA